MSRQPETNSAESPPPCPPIEVVLKGSWDSKYRVLRRQSPPDLDIPGLIDWAEDCVGQGLLAKPEEIEVVVGAQTITVPIDTEPTRDGMAFYLAKVEDVLRDSHLAKGVTSWASLSVRAPVDDGLRSFESIDWAEGQDKPNGGDR